ncbi:hypothetical protein [Hymenobacter coccineus]|nr:hypothetical protein [Hymenobacter coccineus]
MGWVPKNEVEEEKELALKESQTIIQLDKPNQNLWGSQRKNRLGSLATGG